MRVRTDREGKRIARAAMIAGAVLLAVFLGGAAAERARLASHQEAWASLERETRLLGDWIAEWDEPSDTEEEAWDAVRAAYDRAVPAGETRLEFATALNELAAVSGLADFSLVEMPPALIAEEESAMDWEDEDREEAEGWEDPWGDEEESPAAARADRSRYAFEARFGASYRSLVRFLDGLERMSRLVEVKRATIRRGEPYLDVEMEIAVYGRTADAL